MVPKDVIFVIDVSGSMIGTKIKQVKWSNPIQGYRSMMTKRAVVSPHSAKITSNFCH